MKLLSLGLILAVAAPALAATAGGDPRNFANGFVIPSKTYSDQPYIVITKDGNWLCTVTTGIGGEGIAGQHVVATISSDQGRSWSPMIDIEPSSGPSASWVIPIVTPSGRVYAFYNYNGDRVSVPHFPHSPYPRSRDDVLGWYVFKFSDDHGRTWSEERYRLPMPVAKVDLENEWNGRVQLFWGVDKPVVVGTDVMFGFTRIRGYLQEGGEGWFYRSDNLLTESDPAKIRWTLLPEAGLGVRNDSFGSIQDEHKVVPLRDGGLFCIYRTRTGHPIQAYSRDGGRSWTKPEVATYTPGGKRIKHPRACATVWQTANGNYLLWYHNNSYNGPAREGPQAGRNVAWLSGGIEKDGIIHWSEPEVICYQPERSGSQSYPDLVEWNGSYYFSSTNKREARLITADPALIEGLWKQSELREIAREGLVLELAEDGSRAGDVSMPRLPNLAAGGGFALEMWLELVNNDPGQVILTSREAPSLPGLSVATVGDGSLMLELADGDRSAEWNSDPGLLQAGQRHHVVFNVDGAAKLISVVVDGRLCDGGTVRPFGFHRFEDAAPRANRPAISDVSGGATLRIAPAFSGRLHQLRLYDRRLTTTEAIGNYRAGR